MYYNAHTHTHLHAPVVLCKKEYDLDLYHWIDVNKNEVDITLLCSIVYKGDSDKGGDESACTVHITTDGVI